MEKIEGLCATCRTPKVTTECELCFEPLCKKCVQFLSSDSFEYLPKVAEEVSHTNYCQPCFDSTVGPALTAYEETFERAKEIVFLTKSFKGLLPVKTQAKAPVKIESCPDRNELILRLAFVAASEGYNSLIEGDVARRKVRDHAFQKSEWAGSAIPANLDLTRLLRDEYREEVWRRGQ